MSRVEIKVWFFRFFFRTLACLLAWRVFPYMNMERLFFRYTYNILVVGVGGKKGHHENE